MSAPAAPTTRWPPGESAPPAPYGALGPGLADPAGPQPGPNGGRRAAALLVAVLGLAGAMAWLCLGAEWRSLRAPSVLLLPEAWQSAARGRTAPAAPRLAWPGAIRAPASAGARPLGAAAFADLDWTEGQPTSTRFGDLYFSYIGGLDETRYVFLDHNLLPARFRTPHFCVAETGFGTGLNFLATWQAWAAAPKPPGATLEFRTLEGFPLTPADMARAHRLWPELAPFAEPFAAAYATLDFAAGAGAAPVEHVLGFDEGRVRLRLWHGDVGQVLPLWPGGVADAWFLDGFSPSKNPQMWTDEILAEVWRTAAPSSTFATFTAVGRIRRSLEGLGFAVKKRKGFAFKKEMLQGAKGNLTGIFDAAP